MKKLRILFLLLVAGFVSPSLAAGDVVTIDASQDAGFNNLGTSNNQGAHTFVNVGIANNAFEFRSVFLMDAASFVPAGATINSVMFEFDVTQQGGPMGQSGVDIGLFSMTTGWTEGTGTGNLGTSGSGGASWNFVDDVTAWTTPGGDFAATSSGSLFIDWLADGGGTQTYMLGNAQLIADVQNMLDNPGSNFGFGLMALDVNATGSAMRVTSREGGSAARLIIDFTGPAVPEPGSALVLGVASLVAIGSRRRRIV